MSEKLVLIDGNSIIYRAFFALPLLNNNKGIHTNAVYGFTTMLLNILQEEKPTHMLVAFDAGKTTFRHTTYKDYKGGRQKTPSELSEQFPVLKELLDAFGIKHYDLVNYEADDIIGTLATNGDGKNWDITVISGDKDLLQLTSKNITVKLTKKGISQVEAYTPQYMQEKMEIRPEQIIDLKALMGDKSDNIPGVPGVGEKTATKLLKQFTTLENVYEGIADVSGKKLKEKLIDNQDNAFMSKELVTINRSTPITITMEDLVYHDFEHEKVMSMFRDLGFQSLLERMNGGEVAPEEPVELDNLDYEIVDEVSPDIFTGEESLVVEMLKDNYHQAPIIGFGIANKHHTYFIPAEIAQTSKAFKKWAEDNTMKKYVFDAKKSVVALLKHGIKLQGISFDIFLAAYLADPSAKHQDISAVSHWLGKMDIYTNEFVYGKGAKMKLPEQEVYAEHIARKSVSIYTLKDQLIDMLKENEQLDLLYDLELPLALILAKMEVTGVLVDVQRLKEMGEELKVRLDEIEGEIHELAGETFNINSPKQLGPILFEKLELRVIKKTKTGYSTAADVLEKLKDDHAIIPKLLLYRQLGKLQSTYIVGLLKVVDDDTHQVHTRFNQALTLTGRLSSAEPNLQNIPIRLEEGRKIRQAFVPSKKDWIMFAADYSQIELRVLAHIAKDAKLMDAFKNNMDIHTKTAMEVFHVTENEVTANMRRHAKAVNFGIVYGISDYGLSQSLGIPRKEAKQFIEQYLNSYPNVQTYMDDIVQEAKLNGYVTTIMNRRRYLPDITSRNFNLRSFAERTAMNTPIQGSAADIIKKAMIDLDARLKSENLQARILMQVHDELILEAPKEELAILKEIVPDEMENTVQLDVPLRVEYAYGDSWFDAK